MKKFQCIVTDDEPIARQILESYIGQMPNLELMASCKNAFEVMEVLEGKSADILFLDINMPEISGLSLLKTMRQRPSVIITTAYAEYALEGFELAVTDYLLKPFSLERFIQAVVKVKQPEDQTAENLAQQQETSQSIFVKSDKKLLKLNFNEINYVEAYGNYIKIYTDVMILTSQTLSEFLEKLPSNFMRVHKSYVINFDKLQLIDGNQIILNTLTKVPIGKSYKKELLSRMQ